MAEAEAGFGGIVGTRDLQQTVDKFNTAVENLTSTVSNLAQDLGGGMTRAPAMASGASGIMFTSQPGMGSTRASFVQGGGGGGAAYATTPGGPGGSPPGGSGPGGGSSPTFGQMAQTSMGSFFNSQVSGMNNMLMYNAYGQQMAAQWGGSAQAWQNQAFGVGGHGLVNNASMGSPSTAMAEFTTLNQMAGGSNVTSTAAFGATNALAFANQGMGGANAAQLAQQLYNPLGSLKMQMLTGVSAFNQQTGQQNSLSSIIGGLGQQGYIGGGSYNSRTGTFNQAALKASFTADRGTSYMNLSQMGYNSSQIQDIQSMVSQANQAAIKGHTSFQNVMSLMNQASYGTTGSTNAAQQQLAKMGIKQSTIQLQGNLAAQNMGEQQSQSGAYNNAVDDFTNGMNRATAAINAFLNKTGLDKVIGAAGGTAAGIRSTGLGGVASGLGKLGMEVGGGLSLVAPEIGLPLMGVSAVLGALGGGAGSVSTTMPMTSQGSAAGSSMSSVSSSVQTAVQDAERQVGKPYKWGGSNPQTSFDCSGLVMWAYGQAGVRLPRTSQAQWAALSNKSVPLNQVREGDIVFSAGSDGSPSAPGHEALMISNNQIVEAPYTGANIRIRSFNPGEWQHAARPVGSGGGSGAGGTSVSGTQSGATGSSLAAGNAGGGDSSLGLIADADMMLFSGANGGGNAATGMTATASNGAGTSNPNQTFTGGGNSSQNQALAKKMAASMYGWTGTQWSNGLLPLWTQESNFQTKATNPSSGAYGIAQALPADKYASAGSDWKTNPATQIKWGLDYIKGRYGSPLQAEQHEKNYNWYGTGGPIVVGDRGPELFVPDQSGTIKNAKDTANLLRGNSAQVAQSPYTSSPAAQYLLDVLSPASRNHHGSGGGVQVTIQVSPNAINITGAGTSGTAPDVHTVSSAFSTAVVKAMENSVLIQNIANGVTS